MSLGKRLNMLRGAISQSSFGQRLGVSQATIANYEKGERLPDSGFLEHVCNECGVSADWLIFGKDEKEPASLLLVKPENTEPVRADHIYKDKDERLALYEKLVRSQEREIAMLNKYISDLKDVIAANREAPSLSAGAAGEKTQSSVA